MPPVRLLLAAALAVAAVPVHAACDAAAGKNKVYQCQGCHGIRDWKTALPSARKRDSKSLRVPSPCTSKG